MTKFKLPVKKASTDNDKTIETFFKKTAAAASEKNISAVINKGGSVTKKETLPQQEVYKNFNIKILESELKTINDIREKLPKPRGKAMAISLHDWIVEAIQEKIGRDGRK